jgi:hypothetical protein
MIGEQEPERDIPSVTSGVVTDDASAGGPGGHDGHGMNADPCACGFEPWPRTAPPRRIGLPDDFKWEDSDCLLLVR